MTGAARAAESHPLGHNFPPISPPDEADFLDDLKRRYPEVVTTKAELLEGAKGFPASFEDDETAGQVQDLYRKMGSFMASWKGQRGLEKGPWAKIGDIAYTFFKTAEDELDVARKDLLARHTAFAEAKKEKRRRAEEDRAKALREEADRKQREAEEAEQRRVAAEQAEREAREREERARHEAEEAEQRRLAAEARAAAAKAEEERIAREKRERDRAEKEANANGLRSLRQMMKSASDLEVRIIEGKADADDIDNFEQLVLEGGEASRLGSMLKGSLLLDDEQTTRLEDARTELTTMRARHRDRAREQEETAAAERRQKAEAEHERRMAEQAAEQARQRAAHEEQARLAREARDRAEAEAAAAKAEAKTAKQEVREARTEQRDAVSTQKSAAREETSASSAALRTENRAARVETKLEGATDADLSRTRGEYGSVGGLSGRYQFTITDPEKIPLEQLRGYINPDAISAAITKWQRDHQRAWNDDFINDALPGVQFWWLPESNIRGG